MTCDTFVDLVQSRARVQIRLRRESSPTRHVISRRRFRARSAYFSNGRPLRAVSDFRFTSSASVPPIASRQLAALHARSVFETLEDALRSEDVLRLRSLLPADYASLFSPETEDRSRPEPDAHRITAANPLPRGS